MRILLGITGGIAAYKSAELVRLLQKRDYDVFVAMTRNAQRFITPLTLATLSGHRVMTDMYAEEEDPGMDVNIEHIRVAASVDLLLVAPATANILAKFAHGIADDFLSSLFLASKVPAIIAPAMNVNMWSHPTVQDNIRKLRSQGVNIIDPEEGYLAEGIMGKGRLAGFDKIVESAVKLTHLQQDLKGETILITA